MPGLVPGIHVLGSSRQENVDGRDKPGHDDELGVDCFVASLPLLRHGLLRFARNDVKRAAPIRPDGQITHLLSIPLRKNIPLPTQRKSVAYALRPVPQRGVRTSRTSVRDAVDA